jgi:outer membrane protein TolC
MGGRIRGPIAVLSIGCCTAAALGVTGCYHAEPVDAGTLLAELRRGDPLPPPATPGDVASAGPLTEARSVALALAWNRDLRAFRLTRGIAEGEVVTAGRLQNPVLRTELSHLQTGDMGSFGWDLRLAWQPPQPGVLGGRKGAARAHVQEIDHEIAEREWTLACDVRAAHAQLVALDAEAKVAADTIANRRKLVTLVDQRVARGATTLLDRDLARLSLVTAERAESERQLARTVVANTLVHLLGVGVPGGTVAVAGTIDDPAPEALLPAPAELEERALAARPALAAASAHYRVTEETLRAETAARWPWFAFSAAPRVRRNETFSATTDVTVGVDLVFPILDSNVGNVKSATAARQMARADAVGLLAETRSAIARALSEIAAQRALLHRLKTEIAPLLEEHDRLLALAARAAELDLPSMVASEDLVLRARTEVIVAELALRKGEIALERAVGTRVATR